ncbi:VOC family protein [Bremerella sp. P1]|uniref:VOC family protein n=1 Tax=Bremerella sp. P1 TaxID=3026424 RepID=UPI002368B8BF|nr:VOC family protein [Bremerella sp. P1]WDI41395.1 VOC family protein [Bremerella sp. P1]
MPRPIPIKSLNHLALAVRDARVACGFYRDVLGFREVERPPFNFPGAWLVGYGIQIHILETEHLGDYGENPNSRANHYAFAVDDNSDLVDILNEHGIEYIQRVNAGNVHQTFFQDPDGHTIEVAVYPADPPFVD